MNKFARLIVFSLLFASAMFCQAQQQYGFTLPDKKGAVLISPPLAASPDVALKNNDTQLKAEWHSEETGLVITLFVQPAEKAGDSKVCRDTWWLQTEPGIEKVAKIADRKTSEQGDVALVEYTIPEFANQKISQKNVHAYLAGGDIWAEVHISKVEFKPEDQPKMDALVNSIKIKPEYVNTSRDYWRLGMLAAGNKDYSKNQKYFQMALDLEKTSPRLDERALRVMIVQLGAIYGLSGDLAKAKETLEYGISRYPDYGQFHFTLACSYAGAHKMDKSLEELRLAYAAPAGKYPEEPPIADPLKMSCFSELAKQQKFVDEVKAIQAKH
jgi:tetratricopeptide (TPR) repeat protein